MDSLKSPVLTKIKNTPADSSKPQRGPIRRLLDRFLDRAARDPDAVFCHYYARTESSNPITFGDLSNSASLRAGQLRREGKTDGIFFILHDDVEEQMRWWLSVMWAGGIPAILTPPTPKLDRAKYVRDLESILNTHATARIILSPDLSPKLKPSMGKRCLVTDRPKDRSSNPVSFQNRPVDQPMVFQQSSGTTGIRKGILLSEESVLHQLEAYGEAIQMTDQDVIVTWLPLYHDMGLVACLMQSLYHGIPLVLTSPFTWLAHPAWLFETVQRHRGTLCWLPNFAFNLMAERVDPNPFSSTALSSMRLAVNCSEPVQIRSFQKFRDRFLNIGLHPSSLSSCYAMAETTFAMTQSSPGKTPCLGNPEPNPRAIASSGKALRSVKIRIVDDEGRAQSDGHPGEIQVQSDSLFSGYYGIGSEGIPIDRDDWFTTGDIGFLQTGELFVLGRKKDLIIRGGQNIDPGEIEAVVDTIPEVKDGRIAVFGIYNDAEGTEDIVILAEFGGTRVSDIDAVARQIRETVARTLDLSAQRVELVRAGWLLKSSSGKISRTQCREKYLAMLESRRCPRLAISDHSENLPENDKNTFHYFGDSARIRTPVELTWPGSINIGNWVSLGRYGKILMQRDFTHLKSYIEQHYPESAHDLDPAIYSVRAPHLKIGDGTSMGDQFLISCANSIEIGKHVLISARVFITDSQHRYDRPDLPILLQGNTLGKPVKIGDHAWIGVNCSIMEGVTIGRHAVVTANSVVIGDVPDFAVAAGNPARVVKFISAKPTRKSSQASKPRHPSKSGTRADWMNALSTQVREITGLRVDADEPLFTSGLLDSLRTLQLFQWIEERLGLSLNEEHFFKESPNTLSELVRYLARHAGNHNRTSG